MFSPIPQNFHQIKTYPWAHYIVTCIRLLVHVLRGQSVDCKGGGEGGGHGFIDLELMIYMENVFAWLHSVSYIFLRSFSGSIR